METTTAESSSRETDELRCIKDLSLAKINLYLATTTDVVNPAQKVAEETLRASRSLRSTSAAVANTATGGEAPVVAAKKSARIANSSSRYKKFHLLLSGNLTTTTTAATTVKKSPSPSTKTVTTTNSSRTGTPASVNTAGKIKLGFNLVLNKNKSRAARLSDEVSREPDESASGIDPTLATLYTNSDTTKKVSSAVNKSLAFDATSDQRKSLETGSVEDDTEIENIFNDIVRSSLKYLQIKIHIFFSFKIDFLL